MTLVVLRAQLAYGVKLARAQGVEERVEDVGEGAEAHDHELCVRARREDKRPGGGQQVDALVSQQLADIGDVRAIAELERQQRPSDGMLVARERPSVAWPRGHREQALGDGTHLCLRGGERARAKRPSVRAGRAQTRARRQIAIFQQLEHPARGMP